MAGVANFYECQIPNFLHSALFTLYDAALLSQRHSEAEREGILQAIETTSDRIVVFSGLLFGDPTAVNIDTLSPFVPYSLYQAGVVQYRCWRRSGEATKQEGLWSLKRILGSFSLRWQVAGMSFQNIL